MRNSPSFPLKVLVPMKVKISSLREIGVDAAEVDLIGFGVAEIVDDVEACSTRAIQAAPKNEAVGASAACHVIPSRWRVGIRATDQNVVAAITKQIVAAVAAEYRFASVGAVKLEGRCSVGLFEPEYLDIRNVGTKVCDSNNSGPSAISDAYDHDGHGRGHGHGRDDDRGDGRDRVHDDGAHRHPDRHRALRPSPSCR
jgi:hypothetical protein